MAFRRVAEQGIEPVMSREVRIAFLLFGVGSETVFYGDFAIVKDHFGRRSVKDLKAADKSVQKAFFVLAVVCQDDRPAAVAQTGTKKIDLFSLALDIDKSFSPVDLKGFTRVKKEGQEHRRHKLLQLMYFCPYCGFASGKSGLFHETVIDPFYCVALLFQPLCLVFFKTRADKSDGLVCQDR